jgi:hypothetical protein
MARTTATRITQRDTNARSPKLPTRHSMKKVSVFKDKTAVDHSNDGSQPVRTKPVDWEYYLNSLEFE